MNRRLRARDLEAYVVTEDGSLGAKTVKGARKAAWALGARNQTLDHLARQGIIPIGVQRMILNPGRRNAHQKDRGSRRLAHLRSDRKNREQAARRASGKRKSIVAKAKKAASNYRQNPGAYHYLAGGKANVTYLRPTPRDWRSDCSQFVASVYKDASVPSPGDVDYPWVNTWAIDRKGRVTNHPKPGDLGLYGPKGNPHHVELYVGEPSCMFIGHGSPPIDSFTPGLPSYYVTFDFLD